MLSDDELQLVTNTDWILTKRIITEKVNQLLGNLSESQKLCIEKEQRWLHIEDTENVESRAMLETRLNGSEWFLDTFLKSGENRMPLFAENFKHSVGRWFHIALVYDGSEMRHYVDGKLELAGKINFKTFGKGITSVGVRQNKV